MNITVKIDDRALRAALDELARRADRECDRIFRASLKAKVVPVVKRGTPSLLRGTIVVSRSQTGYAITTDARGQKRAIFFLLEEGGWRKSIHPKRKGGALKFPGAGGGATYAGRVRAVKITGKHFLERGVEKSKPALYRDLEARLHAFVKQSIT